MIPIFPLALASSKSAAQSTRKNSPAWEAMNLFQPVMSRIELAYTSPSVKPTAG